LIKNIIFDIGRVLLEFNPKEYIQEKYKDNLLTEELHSAIFGSSEWLDLDRGTITDEEAIAIFSKRHAGREAHISEIMNSWQDILIPIDGTVKLLERLKQKGYKIVLLSNFHLKAFEIIYERYSFFKLADEMIISAKVNLLKPHKEIYEYMLRSLNLKAEECLFIDDTFANVEGAEKLHINAIQFENPKQLEKGLKNLNLL
jgi:epoxide hydrolase-like predicted phosphatase